LAEAIREKRRLRQRFNQYGASGNPRGGGGGGGMPQRPYSNGMNNGRRGEYD